MNRKNKILVLLLPKTSYRNEAFLQAAQRLNTEVIAVQNRCHVLADTWEGDTLLSLPFDRPQEIADAIQRTAGGRKINAVMGVDDVATVAAGQVGRLLSISGNDPDSAERLTNKQQFRRLQQKLGLPTPRTYLVSRLPVTNLPQAISFPVVVKPTNLSASQGVIRANHSRELQFAIDRIEQILRIENKSQENRCVIIEEYLQANEYALEGIMQQGQLETLAVFDKPEPLEGPFFEETIYISPARLDADRQNELALQVEHVCNEAGWFDGPVHAEARINEDGVYLLEVAPRTIGGRCSRSLYYQLGIGLEELVLRHALDEPMPTTQMMSAVGVCMLTVPKSGIFMAVDGIDDALAKPEIAELIITAVPGETMEALPEGNQYIGFIIARTKTSDDVQTALVQARDLLEIRMKPLLNLQIAASANA